MNDDYTMKRLQVLAGIEPQEDQQDLNEEPLAAKIARDIVDGKIKTPEDIKKAQGGFKNLFRRRLNAQEIADLIDILPKQGEKPNAEEITTKIEDAIKGSDKEAPETQQKSGTPNTEDYLKKYQRAVTDIRSSVTPEQLSDDDLSKIIGYLDGLESIKIIN